jgi:hypothetical protein
MRFGTASAAQQAAVSQTAQRTRQSETARATQPGIVLVTPAAGNLPEASQTACLNSNRIAFSCLPGKG